MSYGLGYMYIPTTRSDSASDLSIPAPIQHVTCTWLLHVQVKYTAYRDRPIDERKRRFVEDLHEGHSVIVSGCT